MNAPIVITPVTPAQLDALVAALRANESVVTLAAPGAWTIEGKGIGAEASLLGSTLIVNVVHKPWYVPMSRIESTLRGALAQKEAPNA